MKVNLCFLFALFGSIITNILNYSQFYYQRGERNRMDTYTVSFFGHRQILDQLLIDRKLDALIRRLLLTKPYVEFLVGRDGDFDQLVSSAIRRAKRTVRDNNSAHVWVLPYATAEYLNHAEDYHEYYDEVEICEAAAGSHYKAAFQARNRAMVDRSHLVVFCIDHNSGGAYQTMRYAIKQGIPYINLHTESLEEMEA